MSMNKLKPQYLYPPKLPSTKYWNSIINRLSSQGSYHKVLVTYISMLQVPNVYPDAYTFPNLLKSCIALNALSHGISCHQHAIVNGLSSDPYVSSSLINFYAKFGHTRYARNMFEEMPSRNVVPWTTMIGCYSRVGDMITAFSLYNRMQCEGIKPTSVTMLALLSGVSDDTDYLPTLLHTCVVKHGFSCDIAVMNSMVNLLGKCGRTQDARDVFESMDTRDIVSWNSLVSAYALFGNVRQVLQLLRMMRSQGTQPDQQTLGALVSATARQGNLPIGKMVHAHMLTSGVELDTPAKTLLIAMYLKYGNLEDAYTIFEQISDKDAILWTTMISGLVQNECADKAITLFSKMLNLRVRPSTATIASVLAACSQLGSFNLGTSVHGYIVRQRVLVDIPVQNALLSMYSKCGHLLQSCMIFDMMDKRDLISWNAIISGHAQTGDLCKAMCLFNEMKIALVKPDSITVVSLLQACASLGAYHQGKWIHSFVIRSCLGSCILVDTTLVDMYSKCGNLNYARKCFDRMLQHDLVSWSTIIAGYGSHGKGEKALHMYEEFLRAGFKPNSVIFLSVLSACSHNGLVDHGLSLFDAMTNEFGIEPEVEHCACIVDLLCRARKVEDAFNFYKKMFTEPVADVLGILLDACRSKGNQELSEIIAEEIYSLKPDDAGKYLQLAHNYASTAKWDGVGEAWTHMRSLGLKKLPGWSFIELQGTITTFFTYHSSHPQSEEIVLLLKYLTNEIRKPSITFIQENFMKDNIHMQELIVNA